MAVNRIVTNVETGEIEKARAFYGDILGLEILMDHGWIVTYGSDGTARVQISFASEGGAGTPVPDISVEVDDVDAVLDIALARGLKPEYGPADEAWGVRRFYVRDPFGKLVNVVQHMS